MKIRQKEDKNYFGQKEELQMKMCLNNWTISNYTEYVDLEKKGRLEFRPKLSKLWHLRTASSESIFKPYMFF